MMKKEKETVDIIDPKEIEAYAQKEKIESIEHKAYTNDPADALQGIMLVWLGWLFILGTLIAACQHRVGEVIIAIPIAVLIAVVSIIAG